VGAFELGVLVIPQLHDSQLCMPAILCFNKNISRGKKCFLFHHSTQFPLCTKIQLGFNIQLRIFQLGNHIVFILIQMHKYKHENDLKNVQNLFSFKFVEKISILIYIS